MNCSSQGGPSCDHHSRTICRQESMIQTLSFCSSKSLIKKRTPGEEKKEEEEEKEEVTHVLDLTEQKFSTSRSS